MSLRTRLTLACAVSLAAVVCGLGAVIYAAVGGLLLDEVDGTLRSRADGVLSVMTTRQLPAARPERLLDADESFLQVLAADGHVERTTAPAAVPVLPAATITTLTRPAFFTRQVAGLDDSARLLATPARVGGRAVVLVMGATLGDRRDALNSLLRLYAVAGPIALALTALVGWRLAAAALGPVERMRERAAQIAAAEDARGTLPVPDTGDELSRLATTMNDLLGGVRRALAREQWFVDSASHELRTPLAVLKAELELAQARPRSRQELERVVATASEQTDRAVRLAEDLLVLARTRDGTLPVRLVDTDVDALLQDVTTQLHAGTETAARDVVIDGRAGTARIDPDRVRQAVHNLVQNALRHGEGTVTVSVSRRPGRLRIEVRDQGPGFPPALLPRAFEPFTRAAVVPGSGLGLAVTRAVAHAHGGTASAGNLPVRGALARLELPA